MNLYDIVLRLSWGFSIDISRRVLWDIYIYFYFVPRTQGMNSFRGRTKFLEFINMQRNRQSRKNSVDIRSRRGLQQANRPRRRCSQRLAIGQTSLTLLPSLGSEMSFNLSDCRWINRLLLLWTEYVNSPFSISYDFPFSFFFYCCHAITDFLPSFLSQSLTQFYLLLWGRYSQQDLIFLLSLFW